ncbi:MAG: PKD domain-containing protein [Patescibacteria group bacterium]
MRFSGKKIFLFGFLAVLLVGIPVTVFLVQQQQQDIRSRAEKSTTISFTPESSEAAPLEKQVGDPVALDIMVNPGNNLVSFVKLEIQYDPEKLATTGANTFQPNTVAFPTVLEGPIYSPGKIAVTLSVGPDPTKAIQQVVKAATVNLEAIANTDSGAPTLVTYGTTTQVLSIGASDEASENVLASTVPAAISIGGETAEPTETIPTGSPTPSPISTVQPTTSPGGTQPTVEPTQTTGGTGGGDPNQSPFCSSLTVDRETNGTAPFSITFTANGNDSDGTITQVSFNFGDGEVANITTAGGIGTNQVNVQTAHTYNNPGTYQASGVLTDSNNGSSGLNECVQTIVVTEDTGTGGTGGGNTTTTQSTSASATPSIPPTGTTEMALGIGAIALALIVGGGILFFLL